MTPCKQELLLQMINANPVLDGNLVLQFMKYKYS